MLLYWQPYPLNRLGRTDMCSAVQQMSAQRPLQQTYRERQIRWLIISWINCALVQHFMYKLWSLEWENIHMKYMIFSISAHTNLIREESNIRFTSYVTFNSDVRANGRLECAREGSTSSETWGILPSCFLWVREDGGVGRGKEKER